MKFAFFIVALIVSTTCAWAVNDEPGISEAEFFGAKLGGEEIGEWFRNLESRPGSVAIFHVQIVSPLPDTYGSVIETEVLNNLRNIPELRVASCPDCRAPRVEVLNDRLVVSKGAPNIDVLKELGRKTQTESFLILEVHRTALSVLLQANLYHSGSGDVIQSKTFRIPVLAVSGAASVMMFQLGSGVAFGGSGGGNDSTPPISVGFSMLEELGFGKGGLHLGGVIANRSGLVFLQPTIAWRGRFSSAAVYSLRGFGLGVGVSDRSYGVAPRAFYQIFIGTLTSVGVEAGGLIKIGGQSSGRSLDGYVTGNIGMAFGR